MQVNSQLWQQTHIAGILQIFPGYLGEYLQHSSPAAVLRAQQWLPLILWRWYFLQSESEDKTPPYYFLDWRREVEGWPAEGMFLPIAKLAIPKPDQPSASPPPLLKTQHRIQIDITVDYIDFYQQPLIVDLNNHLRHRPYQYDFESKYQQDIQTLASDMKDFGSQAPKTVHQQAVHVLQTYHRSLLNEWRSADPTISQVFTEQEWQAFWVIVMEQVTGSEGLDAQWFYEQFSHRMRSQFPDYGFVSEEDWDENRWDPDNEFDQMKGRVFEIFWIHCARYWLLPLSAYCQLLAPTFIDWGNFRLDLDSLLSKPYDDPMPIYSAFTHVKLTPFGEKVFK